MRPFSLIQICFLLAVLLGLTSPGWSAEAPLAFAMPKDVQAVLATACISCHGTPGKGNVSLESVDKLPLAERLDLLNKVQDQLFYRMMPPPKADPIEEKDRKVLATWLQKELRLHHASQLDERLPLPAAGNYVDHTTLFDGSITDKPFTPARRWLVSPQIFRERVLDSLGLEGRARNQQLYGVTNPFTLPERSGIRDYDLTVTVDAQIPEHKDLTLRERLDSVTTKQGCIKCHQHMNPLGLAFEMYDDFGRYRKVESLEHPENLISTSTLKNGASTYKTKPVLTTGRLDGTGDPKLDGEVTDALDLIDRLARSERVRQSIIRHAFRFYLGRNEQPNDSQTLINADRAYVASGGSFQAVIVSLLTSDSFLYRK
jgi:cytochrome c553